MSRLKKNKTVSVEEPVVSIETKQMEQIDKKIEAKFANIGVDNDTIADSMVDDNPQKKRVRRTKNEIQKESMEINDIISKFKETHDDKLWEKLQAKYWYGIRKYSYLFVKDADIAADMTIETFIKAYKALDQFDTEKAQFSTWLWTICRNNCLHYLKMKARIPTINSDISDIYDSTLATSCKNPIENGNQYIIDQNNNLTAVTGNEIERILYDVSINEMDKMSGKMSKVLRMKLIDNKKIREIATELNMTESNVKNYLYSGKDCLASIIKKDHKDLYEMLLDAHSEEDELLY